MKKILYVFTAVLLLGCSTDDREGVIPEPDEKSMPIAVDDKFNATENQDFIINVSELLNNDTVVDNARITTFDANTSDGGSVVDNRDGTFIYSPPSDYQGQDTFFYTICVPLDSERCSTATVTITVGDAGSPVANDDTYEIEEGKSLNISNFLNNDELNDNAVVTEVITNDATGTIVIEDDGSLTYTPAEAFNGTDSFSYTICDDDDTPSCSTATITMNVTDEGSPSASDDSVVVAKGNTTVAFENLTDNDALIDDAIITSIDVEGTSGTVTLNDDGTVSYKPGSGYTGTDTFTYSLCDDDAESSCATATVTVNVVETIAFNIDSDVQDYYSDAIFTTDPAFLYQTLQSFTTSKHVNRLEYSDRHDYLYEADADLDDPSMVVLMYSGKTRPDDEYQLGDLDDGETYNTEHIYPQSKLNKEEAANDLHHMRVADVSINSERLNYPFTDGSGDYKLVDGDKWFPGDDWRGDVARMVMYVNLRYGDDFDEVGTLQLFLEWNREDPVSAFEMQRNNVIEGAQGNRNPFIDNPYLATLIWGGQAAENRWE